MARLLLLLFCLLTASLSAADSTHLRKCVRNFSDVSPKPEKAVLTIEKATLPLLKVAAKDNNPAAVAAAQAGLQWLGGALQNAKLKTGQYRTIDVLPGAKDPPGPRMSAEEQAKYKLTVKDGKLYDAEGKLFDTGNASVAALSGRPRAIVIMDTDGNLYASRQHEAAKWKVFARRGWRFATTGSNCSTIPTAQGTPLVLSMPK